MLWTLFLFGCTHATVFSGPFAPAHVLFEHEAINISLFISEWDYFAITAQHSRTNKHTVQLSLQKRPPAQSDLITSAAASDLPTPKRWETALVQGAMTAFNLLAPLVWFSPWYSKLILQCSWTSNFCIFLQWKLLAHPPSASLPLLSLLFLTSGG